MRSAISKSGGNASLAVGRGWFCGGQGVHREMESEGHEEKYRAVIEGAAPTMNRSAKGGARSSLQFGGEGVLIHPPHQGVCGRHGTEEQRVTSGELARSPGGTGASKPISAKRSGERRSVSGRTAAYYLKRDESYVTGRPATE